MGNTRQTVRQLDILRTFQARRYGVTTDELAREYGTTTRTIQRDLNDLKDAGFIIGSKRQQNGRTYYYLESTHLPPVNFPVTEIAALLFVETLSDALEGTPFRQNLHELIQRILALLPEAQAAFLRQAAQAYAPHIRGRKPFDEGARKILGDLNRTILEQKVCRITYQSMEAGTTKTYPIEPLRLLYFMEAGGLYLIARVPAYDHPITLAVERIRDLQPTPKHFAIPAALSNAIEDHLRHTFGIISGAPFEVKVYFTPEQAPYIRERIWHPSQQIEDHDDGGLVITFHAGSGFEIKSWILQHGSTARVLTPDWLREEILDELRATLSAYEKNSQP